MYLSASVPIKITKYTVSPPFGHPLQLGPFGQIALLIFQNLGDNGKTPFISVPRLAHALTFTNTILARVYGRYVASM